MKKLGLWLAGLTLVGYLGFESSRKYTEHKETEIEATRPANIAIYYSSDLAPPKAIRNFMEGKSSLAKFVPEFEEISKGVKRDFEERYAEGCFTIDDTTPETPISIDMPNLFEANINLQEIQEGEKLVEKTRGLINTDWLIVACHGNDTGLYSGDQEILGMKDVLDNEKIECLRISLSKRARVLLLSCNVGADVKTGIESYPIFNLSQELANRLNVPVISSKHTVVEASTKKGFNTILANKGDFETFYPIKKK